MLLIRSYIIAFLKSLPTRTQAGAFRLLSESHPPPHERQPPSADRRLRREKSPKLHLRTLLPCSLHFLSCRTSGGHHTRGDSSKMMWIRFLQSAASSRLLPPSFTSGGHHTRGDSSKMMWIRFLQSAASSRLLPPSFKIFFLFLKNKIFIFPLIRLSPCLFKASSV